MQAFSADTYLEKSERSAKMEEGYNGTSSRNHIFKSAEKKNIKAENAASRLIVAFKAPM